jgi:hypothetical protein
MFTPNDLLQQKEKQKQKEKQCLYGRAKHCVHAHLCLTTTHAPARTSFFRQQCCLHKVLSKAHTISPVGRASH